MDNVHKIKSDYIPHNQSEIKPCVLLLMDLQLDSWKGFEEADPVIRLLIVDNSFRAIRKSYNVWCISGNSSVSVRMIKKSHSKFISESWATAIVVSSRGVIVLRWRAICETALVSCRSFLSTKPLSRKFPSVSGGWDVALKQWALWGDSAQWAAARVERVSGRGPAVVATLCVLEACAAVSVAHLGRAGVSLPPW